MRRQAFWQAIRSWLRSGVFPGGVVVGGALVLTGCGPRDSSGPAGEALQAGERAFQVRGVIRQIPDDHRTLVVRHEAIPAYMPKMTMELTVLETNEVSGLQVGDEIEFRLVARAEDHFIDAIRRLGTSQDFAGAPSGSGGGVGVGTLEAGSKALAAGDLVPDLAFRLETGEGVQLSRWRGQALALTFIFTRCPLPDFCPRMNWRFQEARELLAARSSGPTNWVFLSLSFDSEFDQPAVLRSYAETYRGTNTAGWWFGVLGASGVATAKPAFDLMIGREAGGFSHNLRTVVVDPDGKVHRQFDGNRWAAQELADALMEACGVPSSSGEAVGVGRAAR